MTCYIKLNVGFSFHSKKATMPNTSFEERIRMLTCDLKNENAKHDQQPERGRLPIGEEIPKPQVTNYVLHKCFSSVSTVSSSSCQESLELSGIANQSSFDQKGDSISAKHTSRMSLGGNRSETEKNKIKTTSKMFTCKFCGLKIKGRQFNLDRHLKLHNDVQKKIEC